MTGTPDKSRAPPPFGAGLAALLLVLGVASTRLDRPPRVAPPDFGRVDWVPDPARMAAVLEADRVLASQVPADALAEEATEAILELGRVEVRTGGREDDPEYARETARAMEVMNRYWFSRGKEAFRGLGAQLADRFVRAVDALLVEARRAGMEPRAFLRARADAPASKELSAIGGSFLDHAVSWGLVTPEGSVAGGASAIVRIHFKLRWSRLCNDVMDYTFLLHPEELRALWRWRVEGQRTLTLEKRLDFVRRLRDIDEGFPAYLVLGRVLARQGRYEEAIPYLAEALSEDPFDPVIRRNLSFLLAATGRSNRAP